ncbi:MAG: hypothetical protein M3R55_03980 [Acidobacteriota bacterium]|nr:hypothetical protein [Acidobacteriota bacterium]
MPGSLDTTNTMLAIIAAVSVLQGLVLLGIGIAALKLYKAATVSMREIDERRVKPLMAKVEGITAKAEGILDQVQHLTARVQRKAEKVEAAFDGTVERVDETAHKVRSSVNDTVHRVTDVVGGLRSAIVSALTTEGRTTPAQIQQFPPVAASRERLDNLDNTDSRQVRQGGM